MAEDSQAAAADDARRREWLRYYGGKRIGQQWLQAHAVAALPARRVLEVGPYLGLVTAMLVNAGLEVTTLDLGEPAFAAPRVPHIRADLRTLAPEDIAGFDAVLCCETLEHLPWAEAGRALATFHASGARHLVVSVPYEGWQLFLRLYANAHGLSRRAYLKSFRGLRRFRPGTPPGAHQWEVGYRGTSLAAWEACIAEAGWRVRRREFTAPCRTVLHVLERA